MNVAQGDSNESEAPPEEQPTEKFNLKALRLQLSPEEREWALDIKDMIEMTPEANFSLPDFCCAHWALVLQEDVAGAVRRAIRLQEFREEYDIRDTAQQGRQLIKNYMDLFPGAVLHLDLDTSIGESSRPGGPEDPGRQELGSMVFIHDAVKFDSAKLDSEQKMRTFMGASYYMQQAYFMDCEAVRRGITVLGEYEGSGYANKKDLKVVSRMFSELMSVYPINGRTRNYRTGVLATVMSSILRKIMPEHLRGDYLCGCKSEGGRFDTIYLTPDIETASRRVLNSFTFFLEWRYESEQNFTLACPDGEEPIREDALFLED